MAVASPMYINQTILGTVFNYVRLNCLTARCHNLRVHTDRKAKLLHNFARIFCLLALLLTIIYINGVLAAGYLIMVDTQGGVGLCSTAGDYINSK